MQLDPARIFLKDKSTAKQMLETLSNIYALTTQIYLFFCVTFFFSYSSNFIHCKECWSKFLQTEILLPPAKVAQSLENTSAKSPSTHPCGSGWSTRCAFHPPSVAAWLRTIRHNSLLLSQSGIHVRSRRWQEGSEHHHHQPVSRKSTWQLPRPRLCARSFVALVSRSLWCSPPPVNTNTPNIIKNVLRFD